MAKSLKGKWRSLRGDGVRALLIDVVLIILVFVAIHFWNTRHLARDIPSQLQLPVLAGTGQERAEGVGVVYFFAPWCGYCRHSIGNLESLVQEGTIDWAQAVALEYDSEASIRRFLDESGFSQEVLLGNSQVAKQWGIRAYPTYFVIDEAGQITTRSVGYSTELGLWVRAKLAD